MKKKCDINSNALLWYQRLCAGLETGGRSRLPTTWCCSAVIGRAAEITGRSFSEKIAPAQLRFELGLAIGELLPQMALGEFNGRELMMVSRVTGGSKRLVRHGVIAGAAANIIGPIADGAAAFQIETEFQTARAKTQTPVQSAFGLKIMPLQAHAETVEIAPELSPALRHFAPGPLFGDRFVARSHRANLTRVAGANASGVSLR